ncbi:MAG: DUF444 family protein [Candidatus Spechtbacteria bacterium]|nr:DUF444 family protein [Candidatus Spechtbacteria bacterium]
MKNDFMTESDIDGMKRSAILRYMHKLGLYASSTPSPVMSLVSLDDLLQIDAQREKDGFPKKIKIRRTLAGPGRIIMVPYVEEEQLIHGDFEPNEEEDDDFPDIVGQGEGEVGDVIGYATLGDGEGDGDEEGDDPRAGQGDGNHGVESEAYELGKKLSEEFKLPNLKDKGKKVPTDEYIFDLTDRHPGSGQLLDKKATLLRIVRTNVALGRADVGNIDPAKLIVGPQDKIYRVLSRERVWKSQAIVFFLRDYSGSMMGEPTKAVVTQHLMIYAWLLFQYEGLVIPRFIVHDTGAKEVSALGYFRQSAGGGTLIASGYKKINEIVEGEGLARDYNIYVFQGTDGDDFDDGTQAIPEIKKILGYVNRMGVSVMKGPWARDIDTRFEEYVKRANFIEQKDVFRIHKMSSRDVTDEENIEAIKVLIAQD